MRGAVLGCLAAVLANSAALANDASFQPGLTGDWSGLRTTWQDQGWQFEAGAESEGAYNPSGGARQAITSANQFDIGALADLGDLIGDDGGSLEAVITKRFGAKEDAAAGLGTLMQVQEVYGRGDIWRLTQLSLSQYFFGKALNVELGRMNPGADFDAFSCDFENLNFCGAPAGNVDGDYWFNGPVSQWGTRGRLNVNKALDLEAGIYQINPVNLTRGFSLDFSGGDGVLVPFEAEWKPSLVVGLPGDFRAGGWYSNMIAPDVFYDRNHAPLAGTGMTVLQDHGRRGLYVTAKQQITGDAPSADAAPGTDGKGLSLFFNYTQSDPRTTMLDRQFAGGLEYKGAIESRPDDEIALGFGATHVNGRVAQGEALSFVPAQHTEYVAEFDYRGRLAPGVNLTPNVQYVTDPGGIRSGGNILILGLKTVLAL